MFIFTNNTDSVFGLNNIYLKKSKSRTNINVFTYVVYGLKNKSEYNLYKLLSISSAVLIDP